MLSRKLSIDNISDDHGVKRSPKDIVEHIKITYFDKKKYFKDWLWVFGALALMITFGVGWAFPDGGNPTCDPSDAGKNKTVCGMIDVLEAGEFNFAFLSGFIIAGFVSSGVKLWLARRSAYVQLCSFTRNLLINVASFAPPEERKLLARWTILGFELSVLKARDLADADEGKEYLEVSGLLAEDEWDTMVDGDRHTTVWYWIQARAREISERGLIDANGLYFLGTAIDKSRDRANDLMSPIDRDQPPPYIFVCAILINANLLLYSMTKGMIWSTWMNDAGGSVFTEPRLYCDILILH
eukprot:scaffold219183_cov66-Cyclotella_meneghiniana.AAC.1